MSRGVSIEPLVQPIDKYLLVHFVSANSHTEAYVTASRFLEKRQILPFTLRGRREFIGSDDELRKECEWKLAKTFLDIQHPDPPGSNRSTISSHDLSAFSFFDLQRLVSSYGEAYANARSISFNSELPFVAISRTLRDEEDFRRPHGIAPDFAPFFAVKVGTAIYTASSEQALTTEYGVAEKSIVPFYSPFLNISTKNQPINAPSMKSFTSMLPNGAMLVTPYRIVLPND